MDIIIYAEDDLLEPHSVGSKVRTKKGIGKVKIVLGHILLISLDDGGEAYIPKQYAMPLSTPKGDDWNKYSRHNKKTRRSQWRNE